MRIMQELGKHSFSGKVLAIIPARSGSKGLPDKNIKNLAGKPLIAYSIKAAMESGVFDTVMVSTDSEKYAEIAIEYGAEVPFLRSKEMSSDLATTRDVVLEVLDRFEKSGKKFGTICILQPTSPMRTAQDIRNAMELFEVKNAKAVISVCETDHSPLWINTLPEDKNMERFLDNRGDFPRQQLETYYRLNGAIYLYETDFYLEHEYVYQKECYAYIMSRENSIDIDGQLDFDFAEMLMERSL